MLEPYEKIYMKKLQIITAELKNNPSIENWIKQGIEIIFLDDIKLFSKEIPILCAGDLLYNHVRYWLNINQPAIYTARGYVGNHLYKHRRFYRASVNSWANIKLLSFPFSRWHTMNLPRHPWKVKEINRVLIAPSKMTAKIWSPELDWRWADSMKMYFPGAEIKIRPKLGKQGVRYETLWQDLDWADLVVSQSSAITAEAFWYGKKVISTAPCITWAAGDQLLEDWKNPKEPELRDLWHEHLAWSQFTVEEWNSGESFTLIEQYIGDIKNFNPGYTYNFISEPLTIDR